jgi:hypothetical protein
VDSIAFGVFAACCANRPSASVGTSRHWSGRHVRSIGDESIWYACSYIGEAEAVGDRWSLEVLHFLEDEFGNDSAIYINMRRILQVPCYAPYDEIENIKNCLDVLRAERHNLIARML